MRPPFLLVRMGRLSVVVVVISIVVKLEEVKEVPERRTVERHIGIIVFDDGVREIIAAATRQRLEAPVALDELQDRDVVGVVWLMWPPRVNGETIISGMRGPSLKKSSG